MNHLKLAWRQLALRPGLSFVVIGMLALGIGATTAMFSLHHQILLRPLPVREPERLVNLAAQGPGKVGGNYRDLAIGDLEAQFSYPMFRDLEAAEDTGFTALAGHTDFTANVSFRDQTSYTRGGAMVSGHYFDVLAALFARGLMNISREELGIDAESLVTFGITAQLSDYDQAELLVLYDRIEQELAAQLGVRGVGTTAIPLFYDFVLGGSFCGLPSPSRRLVGFSPRMRGYGVVAADVADLERLDSSLRYVRV